MKKRTPMHNLSPPHLHIKRKVVSISLITLFFVGTMTTYAESKENTEENNNEISSEDVTITHGGRVLRAENLSYNLENGYVTAEKNVYAKDEGGNEYYADSAEFNGDLTEGTINNINGVLYDGSHFSAESATRKSALLTILDKAVYTPCSLCTGDGEEKKPLWQISAKKVTIDSEAERMSYNHATFDVLGIPTFYTPYISHATPGAKRKSGFLAPSYSNINTLGFSVKTPYYFNIAPNIDSTVEPIFTTDEGIVLSGNFRHLTTKGMYELNGSITNPSERNDQGAKVSGKEIRGHIEGVGEFEIENGWNWGFDAKRSTDDTFLRRYQFGNEDVLTSKLFIENITGRNFINAQTISFQGLNVSDDPGATPLVAPIITTHYEKKTGYMNSIFSFDGNALILERDEGVSTRRLSGTSSLSIPYKTNGGHIFELKGSLRGDAYDVEDVLSGGETEDGLIGRVIPEAQLSWSLPLVNQMKTSNVFLEPIAEFIASPSGGNPDRISNEDSQELELSDVNIFSNNHFTGLDRVEGGVRTNYGLRGGYQNSYGDIDFLLGQNYRAKKDSNFAEESGLGDNFSDYVGRVGTTIPIKNMEENDRFELSYRFRVDKDNYVMRRNEVGASFSIGRVSFNSGYVLIDEETESFDTQEIIGAAALKLTEELSFSASGRRDLSDDGGPVYTIAGFTYENECIRILTGWRRDYTRDRDIEPDTSYTFKIVFKHFGGETS